IERDRLTAVTLDSLQVTLVLVLRERDVGLPVRVGESDDDARLLHDRMVRPASDNVELAHRLVAVDALITKWREVQRLVCTGRDQLRQPATDRRRLLQSVTGESVGKKEVWDIRMGTDDRVVVERVDLVMPGPGIEQLDRLEGRHSMRQRRPDDLLERSAIELQVQ